MRQGATIACSALRTRALETLVLEIRIGDTAIRWQMSEGVLLPVPDGTQHDRSEPHAPPFGSYSLNACLDHGIAENPADLHRRGIARCLS
jgi:hypothetical protein